MEATAEALLVTAARGGDRAAYGELFARYQSRIYNYAYGIVGNRDDALDAAQEAFVRVFEALPRLTGELNFSAYVYRATHNIAIDAVKGRSRFESPEILDLQMEPGLRADPERVALVREQQDQAWQAAFKLSDDHRAILTLRELHDLSYQEIAEIMDMPRNTVGVLLSRARSRYKEAFRMSSIDIDNLTAECRDMLPLLSAYLDDELDEKKRARVESHLEECAFCRLALEEMTESSRSYRAILPLLPPAALGEGVWRRLGDLDMSAGPAVSSQGPPEPRPASSHRLALPKLGVLVGGAAVVILIGVLAATGTLGGRGGAGPDGTLGGNMIASSPTTEAAASPTTTSSALSSSTVTAAVASTAPPTTAAPSTTMGPTTTVSTTSASTIPVSSTVAATTVVPTTAAPPSTAPAITAPATTAPAITTPTTSEATSSTEATTVTEAGDTQAPPTPGVIYPAAGQVVNGPAVTLRWKPVKDPSGVIYQVEVESFDAKAGRYVLSRSVDGITGAELSHTMKSTIERWRVTAIDRAGNESKPSAWAKFARPTITAPTVKPTLPTFTLPSLVLPTTTTTETLY